MEVLVHFKSDPGKCPYLPSETASLEYRIIGEITEQGYAELLRRGWRRFGREFFRPACPGCAACQSIRIPVDRFAPSRSQRRALRSNAGIRTVVTRPTVSEDHLRLYHDYHAHMSDRKGWPLAPVSPAEYFSIFLVGSWSFAREFQYYEGERLVGVSLTDVVPTALSSVYFFHDPAWRPRSPGVFSIIQQWLYAKQHSLAWQYLGYWVAACPSMSYKSRYRPHELLVGFPGDHEEPVWVSSQGNAKGNSI